jgi:hypothetical protein
LPHRFLTLIYLPLTLLHVSRTSENSVQAKFAEFLFQALG